MKPVKFFAFILAFYIFLSQILPRVFALTIENENATVVLQHCGDEDQLDCHQVEIEGTLRTSPLTLERYVVKSDGSSVYFNEESIAIIYYPAPES
ncbi:MAG: hypothetical protein GJ680_18150 [Alteromonadaceae bacterium]|nr:hypothetical protein [Alteromonadaceae bacterium]